MRARSIETQTCVSDHASYFGFGAKKNSIHLTFTGEGYHVALTVYSTGRTNGIMLRFRPKFYSAFPIQPVSNNKSMQEAGVYVLESELWLRSTKREYFGIKQHRNFAEQQIFSDTLQELLNYFLYTGLPDRPVNVFYQEDIRHWFEINNNDTLYDHVPYVLPHVARLEELFKRMPSTNMHKEYFFVCPYYVLMPLAYEKQQSDLFSCRLFDLTQVYELNFQQRILRVSVGHRKNISTDLNEPLSTRLKQMSVRPCYEYDDQYKVVRYGNYSLDSIGYEMFAGGNAEHLINIYALWQRHAHLSGAELVKIFTQELMQHESFLKSLQPSELAKSRYLVTQDSKKETNLVSNTHAENMLDKISIFNRPRTKLMTSIQQPSKQNRPK